MTKESKPQFSLMPPEVLRQVAEVFTFGVDKYSKNDWQKKCDFDFWLDKIYRHLNEYQSGNYLDKESDLPHLAHMIADAMILAALEEANQ